MQVLRHFISETTDNIYKAAFYRIIMPFRQKEKLLKDFPSGALI